jgi:hypothetical protein
MKKHAFTLFFLFFTLLNCFSQNPQDSVKKADKPIPLVVELKQGSTLRGKLVERRGDTIVIDVDNLGLIKLPMNQIKNIDEAGTTSQYKIVYETGVSNKYANRTLLAPTAIDNGKGVGEYNNYYLFFNQVSGGLTNNIRLGGLAVIVPEGGVLAAITAKFSYDINDIFHVSVGGLAGGVVAFGGNDNSKMSLVYGLGTLGNKEKNVTLGIGGMRTDGEWETKPVVLVSGMYRIASNWSLSAELFSFKRQFAFSSSPFTSPSFSVSRTNTFTVGAKYFTNRVAINFGFFALNSGFTNSNFIPLPVVGVSVPLDKKQIKKVK